MIQHIKASLGFLLACLVLSCLVDACTPQARRLVVNGVLDVLECVLAHQAEPDAKVVALCAGENVSPEEVLKVLASQRAALAAERAAAERAAAERAAIAAAVACVPQGPYRTTLDAGAGDAGR